MNRPSALPPLLQIAHRPPTVAGPADTVAEAVRRMVEAGVGAVGVVEDGRLVGVFTERDLLKKVVHGGLDPARTRLAEVMAKEPFVLPPEGRRGEALALMDERHIRHVPIVGADGVLLGMLSIRHLLHHQLRRVEERADSLEAYHAADGAGG